MSGNSYRSTVLKLIILLLASVPVLAAVPVLAENGPDLPSAPAARPGFVPGPEPQQVTPASPGHAHPAQNGGPLPGTEPAVVRFSDIALPSIPSLDGPVRSHIQGEVFQAQGGVDQTSASVWPT